MFALKRISSVFTLVTSVAISASIALAQVPSVGTNSQTSGGFPSVGTNGVQQPVDLNSLPPEVRQLIPQNQYGGGMPQPAVVPMKPPGVSPGTYPNYEPQESFPDFNNQSSQPAPRMNGFSPATPYSGQREEFTPSEVISVLPPVPKSSELRAVLRTSVGDITIKLDRANAPMTVAHFVGLARGEKEFIDVKTSKPTKRPFYNGLTFHRVVRGYLVQTGCPFGTGRGTAGDIAKVPDEIRPSMKFNRPGLVAMAPQRDASGLKNLKESNSSQFFITTTEMPSFDDQFTIFGEVEDGMDVVAKIAAAKVGPTERPIKRIYLVAVEIIEGVSVK